MAITLEVLNYSSPDVSDLIKWDPESPNEILFCLEMEIGEKGKEGGHLFQVLVATPEAIRHFCKKYDRTVDRNLLIILDYSWTEIDMRIRRIVESCCRDNWNNSMLCLNRYFKWEYEE